MADRQLFPGWRAISIAVAAGLAAGAVAVYVTGGPSGNNAQAPAPAVAEASDDACAAKASLAKALADKATGDVAAMLPASPPQSVAALAFAGPDGQPMTVASLSGKTLLINLWATWCYPCREEMPALDNLQRQAGSEDFEVVAINVDTGSDEEPKAFLSETGIEQLGYYRESSLRLFNDVKKRGLALGLPATFLIDEDGCLLAHMNGPATWDSDDAVRWIGEAVKTAG
jgi:thiol-disulfide isomerase/thioredoxin